MIQSLKIHTLFGKEEEKGIENNVHYQCSTNFPYNFEFTSE